VGGRMYDERGEMYISLFAARFDVLWKLCVCVKLCVGLGLLWVEMGDLEGCVVSGLE
jgi:hypothetical protein